MNKKHVFGGKNLPTGATVSQRQLPVRYEIENLRNHIVTLQHLIINLDANFLELQNKIAQHVDSRVKEFMTQFDKNRRRKKKTKALTPAERIYGKAYDKK